MGEYKALFLETCPKNSLWTEVSPNMIGYKLTKVFYERAYAGLEPLAMESMMRFPKVAGCSEEMYKNLAKMENEVKDSRSVNHMNVMPFFKRALEWYRNYN